jgi:ribosomal protein S27AE
MDLVTATVFKRHPDRFHGTWWPCRIGRAKAARIACPKCGEIAILKPTLYKISRTGIVSSPVLCPNEGCWVGRVKLDGWEI